MLIRDTTTAMLKATRQQDFDDSVMRTVTGIRGLRSILLVERVDTSGYLKPC